MDKSRREFLKVGTKTGLGIVIGIPIIDGYANQSKSLKNDDEFHTIEQIESYLVTLGLKPYIKDNGGNRYLAIIQDIHHFGDANAILNLFNGLSQNFGLSKVFLENVYSDKNINDPYLEFLKDSERIAMELRGKDIRFLMTADDIAKFDDIGYKQLSKEFETYGLEDKDIANDTFRMYQIMTGVFNLYSSDRKKKQDVEKRIQHHYSKLETVDFETPEFPEILNSENRGELWAIIKKQRDSVTVGKRNDVFCGKIDGNLRSYETGGLIIGPSHVNPDGKDYSLLPCLDDRCISYAIVRID